jgi:hypothetical protein
MNDKHTQEKEETRLRWRMYLERNSTSRNSQNAKRKTQNALKPRLCDSELNTS